ncbi:MarR family winged helix-turn-helix transcriptional regulator [Pseudonocardia charpentierae]|uniref:MarR family transcriptional regulator n=1 Tax=Pseudonocardia charpentierae TaxID=3075545 RepID=A0ABU2N9P3_9PSEU|nr:MarR family transcriptional regulator [Pseudonocardia sp. DSM 45834]MDT0350203.1 MarR family transcriptional regulator [Pseudonocardia sp. DSM 45834]
MDAVKQDDVADLAAPTQAPEPRWLEGIERDAWLSLIGVIIRLPAALDAQLQRDAGLSHFEYTVMVNLSNADDHVLRMSQLAALCHSSLSRLSHVVARLERRGWLRRDPCPDDGRATLATLTDDGFAKLASAAPGHVDAVRAYVIDALDPEQLGQLSALGDTILGRLDGDTPRR